MNNNNNNNVGTQGKLARQILNNKKQNKFAKPNKNSLSYKRAMQKPKKAQKTTRNRKAKTSGLIAQYNNAKRFGFAGAAYREPHTMAFAHVYLDPFCTNSARIPHFPVMPTQLVRNWVLTNGLTNASGVGWVVGRWANGVVNDLPCMVFTAGPTAPAVIDVSVVTDTSVAFTNSQYTTTNFTVTESDTFANSMRLVGVGCRVAYDGPLYTESGRVYSVEASPRNQSVNTWQLSSVTNSTNFKQSTFAKRGWAAVVRKIDQEEDFEFQQLNSLGQDWTYINEGEPSMDDQYNWVIYISGAPPNTPFSIEYSCHFEMNGFGLHQKATTVPNETGVGQVVSARAQVTGQDNTTPDNLAHVKNATPQHTDSFIQKGLKIAEEVLPEAILGFLG